LLRYIFGIEEGLKRQLQVKNKYQTEKYICIKNNTIEKYTRIWALISGSVLLEVMFIIIIIIIIIIAVVLYYHF